MIPDFFGRKQFSIHAVQLYSKIWIWYHFLWQLKFEHVVRSIQCFQKFLQFFFIEFGRLVRTDAFYGASQVLEDLLRFFDVVVGQVNVFLHFSLVIFDVLDTVAKEIEFFVFGHASGARADGEGQTHYFPQWAELGDKSQADSGVGTGLACLVASVLLLSQLPDFVIDFVIEYERLL